MMFIIFLLFRNVLSLSSFVKYLKPYDNAQHSDQLYKALAWTGLQGTNAWNNMYADSVFTQNEQYRIKTTIQNFINSGNISIAKGLFFFVLGCF